MKRTLALGHGVTTWLEVVLCCTDSILRSATPSRTLSLGCFTTPTQPGLSEGAKYSIHTFNMVLTVTLPNTQISLKPALHAYLCIAKVQHSSELHNLNNHVYCLFPILIEATSTWEHTLGMFRPILTPPPSLSNARDGTRALRHTVLDKPSATELRPTSQALCILSQGLTKLPSLEPNLWSSFLSLSSSWCVPSCQPLPSLS